MLESVKIQTRQSEIRSANAELSAIGEPTEEQVAKLEGLLREYRSNEAKYRAALIAEDHERREAKDDLETRDHSEWSELLEGFEMRQAILHLDEGAEMSGKTAEVVTELRSHGGYRGVPIPPEVLEVRAGETVSTGIPNPVQTRPIIDRLFPSSVAGRMGVSVVTIPAGQVEYPITTSAVAASWAATETGDVGDATPFTTANRSLAPNNTLGIQMKLTRKAMKATAGIEEAIRRDMQNAMAVEIDRVVFRGSGTGGEPLGVITGADPTYGVTVTPIDAAVTWPAFREAVVRFMAANAVAGPGAVRALIRPEVWAALDGAIFDPGSGMTEWERLTRAIPAGQVTVSPHALAAPAGTPLSTTALLTTRTSGQAPIYVGMWGAIDLIRDPYSDAKSGGLRITALTTMDVTVSRAEQIEVLTGLE